MIFNDSIFVKNDVSLFLQLSFTAEANDNLLECVISLVCIDRAAAVLFPGVLSYLLLHGNIHFLHHS